MYQKSLLSIFFRIVMRFSACLNIINKRNKRKHAGGVGTPPGVLLRAKKPPPKMTLVSTMAPLFGIIFLLLAGQKK
jgi:hypothetical protein